MEVLVFRQGLGLGGSEWRRGLGLQFSVVLLDFLVAEYVDDLGSWIDSLLDEFASDFVGVWAELGDGATLEMEVQRLHGILGVHRWSFSCPLLQDNTRGKGKIFPYSIK